MDPPAEISSVMEQLNIPCVDKAGICLEQGMHQLEIGDLKSSARAFQSAIKYAGENQQTALQAQVGLAAVELRSGAE